MPHVYGPKIPKCVKSIENMIVALYLLTSSLESRHQPVLTDCWNNVSD